MIYLRKAHLQKRKNCPVLGRGQYHYFDYSLVREVSMTNIPFHFHPNLNGLCLHDHICNRRYHHCHCFCIYYDRNDPDPDSDFGKDAFHHLLEPSLNQIPPEANIPLRPDSIISAHACTSPEASSPDHLLPRLSQPLLQPCLHLN